MKKFFAMVLLAFASVAMADYTNDFSTGLDGTWDVDRHAPGSFSVVDGHLEVAVEPDNGNENTWSGWEGMYYDFAGNGLTETYNSVGIDLYVETEDYFAQTEKYRATFWAHGWDSTTGANQLNWPILGLEMKETGLTWVVWESYKGWSDISADINYGDWNTFDIQYNLATIDYLINGVVVYTQTTTPDNMDSFKGVIAQVYDYGADYGYTVSYDNLRAYNVATVPAPAAVLLSGLGTCLAGFVRRRS